MSRIKPKRSDRPVTPCSNLFKVMDPVTKVYRRVHCEQPTRHSSGLCYNCRKGVEE